ncbi:hypothetical protein [Bizionia sp.]|uniref:hypothetical protein n=1 Tax=Bizionia sp. TaxID=1954480 RepID=UPI003A8F4421
MYVCMLFISYGCTSDDSKTHATADDATMARSFKAPPGLISPERAQELNDNWSATRANAIQASIGKPDNRSVQFTLQDMRDYLDYAENQAQSLGYDMNGVRIYFAAYGEHETNGKAGYATVFLVPTGRKNVSEASMIPFLIEGDGDIPGGDGLNMAGGGDPPSANYPQ